MRIYGNREQGLANLAAGRERARLRRLDYLGTPVRPPERGALLKTIRVTDHIKGVSYVVTIHQGDRLNNIEPRLHGQPFVKSITCGFDELFRALRKRWSLRWLILN
jgi:hypothetical protein